MVPQFNVHRTIHDITQFLRVPSQKTIECWDLTRLKILPEMVQLLSYLSTLDNIHQKNSSAQIILNHSTVKFKEPKPNHPISASEKVVLYKASRLYISIVWKLTAKGCPVLRSWVIMSKNRRSCSLRKTETSRGWWGWPAKQKQMKPLAM